MRSNSMSLMYPFASSCSHIYICIHRYNIIGWWNEIFKKKKKEKTGYRISPTFRVFLLLSPFAYHAHPQYIYIYIHAAIIGRKNKIHERRTIRGVSDISSSSTLPHPTFRCIFTQQRATPFRHRVFPPILPPSPSPTVCAPMCAR